MIKRTMKPRNKQNTNFLKKTGKQIHNGTSVKIYANITTIVLMQKKVYNTIRIQLDKYSYKKKKEKYKPLQIVDQLQ